MVSSDARHLERDLSQPSLFFLVKLLFIWLPMTAVLQCFHHMPYTNLVRQFVKMMTVRTHVSFCSSQHKLFEHHTCLASPFR